MFWLDLDFWRADPFDDQLKSLEQLCTDQHSKFLHLKQSQNIFFKAAVDDSAVTKFSHNRFVLSNYVYI